MKHAKALVTVLAALALTGVTACNAGLMQAGPATEALGYMRAHPVPAVAGMVPAVILTADVAGFAGAAARQAGCPASETALHRGTAGHEPACGAWSGTAETAKGDLVTFTCGSITYREMCSLMQIPGGYIPGPGDYVRLPLSGYVATAGEIRVITEFAVEGILQQSPDPGGPSFVTAPAGSA